MSAVPVRVVDPPLIGWRLWSTWRGGSGLTSYDRRERPWPRGGRVHVAACGRSGHDAPAPGCTCGIYAWPDAALLCNQRLVRAVFPARWQHAGVVCGQVALSGRVVRDGTGVLRAERADVLTVVRLWWPLHDGRMRQVARAHRATIVDRPDVARALGLQEVPRHV